MEGECGGEVPGPLAAAAPVPRSPLYPLLSNEEIHPIHSQNVKFLKLPLGETCKFLWHLCVCGGLYLWFSWGRESLDQGRPRLFREKGASFSQLHTSRWQWDSWETLRIQVDLIGGCKPSSLFSQDSPGTSEKRALHQHCTWGSSR